MFGTRSFFPFHNEFLFVLFDPVAVSNRQYVNALH